jgi:DNA-binding XRE family transcriptional regulator
MAVVTYDKVVSRSYPIVASQVAAKGSRPAEYDRLCREAGEAMESYELPAYPQPDKRGRVPALEYTRISMARNLIRDRKNLGLSQQRLAELAGVRQETISRPESGKHLASAATVRKIERAIQAEHLRKRS